VLNKQRIFVCIVSSFFIALSSCFEKAHIPPKERPASLEILKNNAIADGEKMNNKEELKILIKNVPQEVKGTTVWDFKYSESFLKLEEYSYELLEVALELLKSDELDLQEKEIIVYVVQNVDLERLKYFFRDLAICLKDGKIDEYLVDICILPRDNWSYVLMRNYKDPVIREAFNICLKCDKINPDFKDLIQLAKCGELWSIVREQIIEIRKEKGLAIDDLGPPPFPRERKGDRH